MKDNSLLSAQPVSIAAAQRDTGLSKDTLRVWERRYGFPAPLRDAAGERAYPPDQVHKLRLVKRLIDAGFRPGRIVAMPMAQLQQLAEGEPAPARGRPIDDDLETLLELLRAHEVSTLSRQLGQACMRMGLARFVTDLVAPLNTRVGEAWMRGRLAVFEEHAYTELVQTVLRGAIERIHTAGTTARPRVLLTTFPGEPHGLGLLMAQALLALEGASCVSLGVATPVWDIALAAEAYRGDVVALSFTGCMNPNQVVEGLAELRSKVPPAVQIWAGGAQPALHRRPVPGVQAIAALGDIHAAVQHWRESAQGGARP
jgi:MerR family transcriptional regulator, light-induced transcriptional regulator